MNAQRAHPFTLVFGALASEKFPPVRDALQGNLGFEHFLMTPAAVELLHELRPDEGLGDAVDDFTAFVHAAFCFWADGAKTASVDEARLRRVLANGSQGMAAGEAQPPPAPSSVLGAPPSRYVQLPSRVLWSRVEGSEFHEPVDGWFVVAEREVLRVVACLGVHAERPGLSVVTASGVAPTELRRDDGGTPFAPTMDGGAAAGLHSVTSGDELLWLAART